MEKNKENYLEIHVGISTHAKWFLELKRKMKEINVDCKKRFHITAIFMNDDSRKDELRNAFSRLLIHRYSPVLTFNKLDVFTNRSGTEHIVNLTSTSPEKEFQELVESLRQEASRLGIEMEPYRLHVTLAKVDTNIISLDELKKIIDGISFRAFKLSFKTLEYRYKNPNQRKRPPIGRWVLKEPNKPIIK